MIFLILALIWAVALLPPFLRSRMTGDPVDSVGKFRSHLRVLEQSSTVGIDPSEMPTAWAQRAAKMRLRRRRQQVSRALLAAMATTLILGLIPALRPLLIVHVMFDIAFAFYVYSLAQVRNRRRYAEAAERAKSRKVHLEQEAHRQAL